MKRIIILAVIIALVILVVVFYYMGKPSFNESTKDIQEMGIGESEKIPSFDTNDNLDQAIDELNASDSFVVEIEQ